VLSLARSTIVSSTTFPESAGLVLRIMADGFVLTIDRAYFDLSGGLEGWPSMTTRAPAIPSPRSGMFRIEGRKVGLQYFLAALHGVG
jgi:hypothetical protein